MTPVRHVAGVAAALPVDNISTDVICPSDLIAHVAADFGAGLFGPWRYDAAGAENPDFVLNQLPFRTAKILLAGANFGCGSSREQAVWCCTRFGFGCILAPSFADIFMENASKNGLLTLALPDDAIAEVGRWIAAEPVLAVDLETQTIQSSTGASLPFAIEPARRAALLEGLEEIDQILRESDAIGSFQQNLRQRRPWLFDRPPAVETA